MKRAKLILTVIAIFAIVGCVLGFNMRNGPAICTGSATNSCSVLNENAQITTTTTVPLVFYTTDVDQCDGLGNDNHLCTSQARMTGE